MWTVKIRNSKLTDVWKVKTFKDEFLQFHEYWYCPTGKTFPANFNVLLTFLFYSSSLKDKISLARRLNCDWGVLIRRRRQRSLRLKTTAKWRRSGSRRPSDYEMRTKTSSIAPKDPGGRRTFNGLQFTLGPKKCYWEGNYAFLWSK